MNNRMSITQALLPIIVATSCLAGGKPYVSHAAPVVTRSEAGMVTLSCKNPGATLRYSLDGTEPSSDAMTYLEPFPLPEGGTVKVRAYGPGNQVLSNVVTVSLGKATGSKAASGFTLSPWNGFQKKSFVLNGVPAYVVEPGLAAPGKPWIWRTSWPDYHSEVDVELLRCGFHVAYIDTVNLLGCDTALDIMDGFYDHVRAQFGLAEKCAIEPNSRGGLHAYRYAVRHPARVACILGDVPVMDFKSWPGKHPERAENWQQIMQGYGFKTEAEAMVYSDNPIDQLAPIAQAKIPLRHTICLTDTVVPPEQNTLEAKRRLEKLGWGMELVVVPTSTECEGHHFPFPETFASAQFVMRHASVMPKPGVEYFELRAGLANCQAKFEQEKAGRVAFVGGSITFNSGWRDEVMKYLQERFPGTQFEFIASGISSVGSVGHAFRLDTDILNKGPIDLVFVEAAVNDHNYDTEADSAGLARCGMEGVVRQLRMKSPMTDVVEMHFIHNLHLDMWKAGKPPYTVVEHEKVAEHYGCPSLNLSREVTERIDAGEFTWGGDFRDLHPSPYGQRVYANSMMRMLDAAFLQTGVPQPHPLPAKPLDERSFVRGRHGRLEDAVLSKGFVLDPLWNTSQAARPGYSRCPALTATAAGAELSYTFEGTGFGFFLAAGHDTGIIEVSTDGAPFKTIDTWTPWSNVLAIPWPKMLETGLKPGKHTITVRTTDKAKERQGLHIIHVLLN